MDLVCAHCRATRSFSQCPVNSAVVNCRASCEEGKGVEAPPSVTHARSPQPAARSATLCPCPAAASDVWLDELLYRPARPQSDCARGDSDSADAAADAGEEGGEPAAQDRRGAQEGQGERGQQQERCAPLAAAAAADADGERPVATAALRRKKAYETELDKLAGTRLTLETQVNTIESANLNAETMAAMKRGADALKVIHGTLYARAPARAAPRG